MIEISTVKRRAAASRPTVITTACPCCNQPSAFSSLDAVTARCGLDTAEASILGAVWAGKGMPICSSSVVDAMYADDPDGGPTPTTMYLALKASLGSLRLKLLGSGVGVADVYPRRGLRLVMTLPQ